MDLASIVDVLKNPLCAGPARTRLLKELGRRYGQKFANVWEFMEWAEVNQPELDLRAPLGKL